MSPDEDSGVGVQGLGELDHSVYRRWVERVLLITVAGYGAVFSLDIALRGWGYPANVQGLVVLVALFGLVLSRRNALRWAVILPVAVIWLDLVSSLAFTAGSDDFGLIALPVLVLVVGVVFGTLPAVAVAAGTTVSASALVAYAILVNDVPVSPAEAVYRVVVTSASMFATAGIVSVAVGAFASVLGDARLSAQHLANLMAQAPDGILVLGRGGKVESANPAAMSILGRAEDELVGRTLEEILVALDAETDTGELARVADPSEEGAPRRVWWRKGPRTLWTEVTARVYSRNGVVSRQVMLRDVTLRQQALEEQRIVRDRLEDSQRLEAVGRLAGGIAHDFRNLLTVMGNASELIAEDTDGETRKLAVEIGDAAASASSLTTQLLAFARKEIVQPVALDLGEVLHFMELGVAHLLGPDTRLRLDLPDAAPRIVADRSQLEQVVFNLVRNAGDAVEGKGTVALTVTPPGTRVTGPLGSVYEVPAGYVELRVADDGVGMSGDVLEHVFEPYYTTKALGHGTGLGLSSVHGVVTQAGGQVRVESRDGVGTSVHVLWPVATYRDLMQSDGGETE